jgi:protein gp37
VSGKSAIEWTGRTWNPVTGCTKVSPGCAHCYAEELFAVMALTPHLQYQVLTKRPERMREYCSAGRLVPEWPLRNCWVGVTVENQRWADERIPLLLATPAAVRFVSVEPMLGPVDIVRGYQWARGATAEPYEPPLQWCIIGGESGRGHRAFNPDWARALVAQCRAHNVAPFIKQLGGARPGNRLEDLPEDLRIREWPA